MSDERYEFEWHPLPPRSQRRVNWDAIYNPLAGFLHAAAERTREECTPQRLTRLKTRAAQALSAAGPEFAREVVQLRRERYRILAVAAIFALACIVLGCVVTTNGYDLLKSALTASGTGGLMTWCVTYAFRRVDLEAQLSLFTTSFALQFQLCRDCDDYEKVFERFAAATESLRGK